MTSEKPTWVSPRLASLRARAGISSSDCHHEKICIQNSDLKTFTIKCTGGCPHETSFDRRNATHVVLFERNKSSYTCTSSKCNFFTTGTCISSFGIHIETPEILATKAALEAARAANAADLARKARYMAYINDPTKALPTSAEDIIAQFSPEDITQYLKNIRCFTFNSIIEKLAQVLDYELPNYADSASIEGPYAIIKIGTLVGQIYTIINTNHTAVPNMLNFFYSALLYATNDYISYAKPENEVYTIDIKRFIVAIIIYDKDTIDDSSIHGKFKELSENIEELAEKIDETIVRLQDQIEYILRKIRSDEGDASDDSRPDYIYYR